jgi:hypothetical protein
MSIGGGKECTGYSDCRSNCHGLEIIFLAGIFFSLLFSFLEHIEIQITISDSSSCQTIYIEDNYCVICFYPSFDWQYVCVCTCISLVTYMLLA